MDDFIVYSGSGSEYSSEDLSSDVESSEDLSSEVESSEDLSSEVESSEELSSEEDSSEEVSSQVVYTESSIPEETINQIAEIRQVAVIGLALFGSLFFLIVFDIVYKKLSRFF